MSLKEASSRPGVREVADGIFLYTTRLYSGESLQQLFVYEVESSRADGRGVDFGLDFSGSKNVRLTSPVAPPVTRPRVDRIVPSEAERVEDQAGQEQGGHARDEGAHRSYPEHEVTSGIALSATRVSVVQPFCRTVAARLVVLDPKREAIIKHSCSWELLDPPRKDTSLRAASGNAVCSPPSPLTTSSRRGCADFDDSSRGATHRAEFIAKRCRMHGVLYTDLDFPATDESLGHGFAAIAKWRRPRDFPDMASPRDMAFGGYDRPLPGDVRACSLAADASLACALAALAERPFFVSAALCGRKEFCRGHSSSRAAVGGGIGRTDGDAMVRPRDRQHREEEKNARAADAAELASMIAGAGVFCARLCVGGVWREYVMDDLFPCHAGAIKEKEASGGPCLTRAHGSAMWVCMLEKACARAVGSYTAALCGDYSLDEGVAIARDKPGRPETGAAVACRVVARPDKFLAMLTGAPTTHMKIEVTGSSRIDVGKQEAMLRAQELWTSANVWVEERWLVCLSTPGADSECDSIWKNGLRQGFAYTLLSTADLGGEGKLFRLRGPLPRGMAWTGTWADTSPAWTHEALRKLGAGLVSNRGSDADPSSDGRDAFWMSLDEVMAAFQEVCVCMLGPQTARLPRRGLAGWAQQTRRRVYFSQHQDTATRSEVARDEYWQPSAMYSLSVHETSRMYFTSYQESGKPQGSKAAIHRDTGVTVLRVTNAGARLKAVASTGNPAQAVATVGAVLSPGSYIVVPTYTSSVRGSTLRYREGVAEGEHGSSKRRHTHEDKDDSFPREVASALMAMFDGLDADCDGLLCKEELADFLRRTEGLPLSDERYDWLLRRFSARRVPGSTPNLEKVTLRQPDELCLTRRGFVEMYRSIYEASGSNLEVVAKDLRYVGLDPRLEEQERLSVVVAVHSDTAGYAFVPQAVNPATIIAALTLPIKRWGSTSRFIRSMGHHEPDSQDGRYGTEMASDKSAPMDSLDRHEGVRKTETSDPTEPLTEKGEYEALAFESAPDAEVASSRCCSQSPPSCNASHTPAVCAITPTGPPGRGGRDREAVVALHIRTGTAGCPSAVSFAVESLVKNTDTMETLEVTLDCTGSTNVTSLSGPTRLIRKVILPPGQLRLIQHLVPVDPWQPWSWTHAPLRVAVL